MEDTGRLGRPGEYFIDGDPSEFPPGWAFWEDGPLANEHGVTTRQDFLDLVYRLGATDNGVFGIKLMWNNLPWVTRRLQALPQFEGMSTAELLPAVFPALHMIHIIRRDRVGQAISWAKAAQDGVWVATDDAPAAPVAAPVYNFELIRGLAGLIEEGERGWRHLFREIGVEPYAVVYEELDTVDGYRAAVNGVAEHLGVELDEASLPRPRSRRQADDVNDDWRRQYLDDLVRT